MTTTGSDVSPTDLEGVSVAISVVADAVKNPCSVEVSEILAGNGTGEQEKEAAVLSVVGKHTEKEELEVQETLGEKTLHTSDHSLSLTNQNSQVPSNIEEKEGNTLSEDQGIVRENRDSNLLLDPDSPTSKLLERAAQRSLEQNQGRSRLHGEENPRFDYQRDIARNPRLARAARLELDAAASAVGTPSVGTPSASCGGTSFANKHSSNTNQNCSKDRCDGLSATTCSTPNSTLSSSPVKITSSQKKISQDPNPAMRSMSPPVIEGSISVPLSMTISSSMDGIAAFGHGADIDRQSSIISQLDKDADNESKINADMASILLKRVVSGRNASERILSAVQAFATAETAFSRAAEAVASIQFSGEADGPTLRKSINYVSELPCAVAEIHSKAASDLTKSIPAIRDITQELRVAAAEINSEAAAAQRSVDSARKKLKSALRAHKEACKSFDAKLAEKNKIGSRSRTLESDPWIAEGRLVEKQSELQIAQSHQRSYLARAFRRVGELERRRIDATGAVLKALAEACSRAMLSSPGMVHATNMTIESLNSVDKEKDLEEFTLVANQCIQNGDSLSKRQEETIEHLGRELFGSPEIIRQGPLLNLRSLNGLRKKTSDGNVATYWSNLVHNQSWEDGYAILTRAGFLHWFASGEDGEPTLPWGPAGGPSISLNLARCSFEPGDAPSWRLVEATSKGWTLGLGSKAQMASFRATNVEACMMWTADVREVIAACGALI